jgi:hypothetical protein
MDIKKNNSLLRSGAAVSGTISCFTPSLLLAPVQQLKNKNDAVY